MDEEHTDECRYYITGNFNDCDCKEKEKQVEPRWAKEPFLRLDVKGNVIEGVPDITVEELARKYCIDGD